MAGQEQLFVDFKRSGGFAGIETKVQIYADSLSESELSQLTNLIDQSGFFVFDKSSDTLKNVPDQFEYHIGINYKNQKRTLDFEEGMIPEQFSDLLRYLTQKARSKGSY